LFLSASFIIDLDPKMEKLSGNVNISRWLLAVLVQLTCGEQLAGERNYKIWGILLNWPGILSMLVNRWQDRSGQWRYTTLDQYSVALTPSAEGTVTEEHAEIKSFQLLGQCRRRFWETGCTHPLRYQWHLRFRLDNMINGVCRQLILYFIPIYLSSTEKTMDFVLNCTAIFFILNLDDLKKSVPLCEMALKLKFQEFLKAKEKDINATPEKLKMTKREEEYANSKRKKFHRFEAYFQETWKIFLERGRSGEETALP